MLQEIKKCYGNLAYVDGKLVKVVEHSIVEDADGIQEEFYCQTIGVRNDYNIYSNIILIDDVKFYYNDKVTTAIIKVDGKTKVGYAICSPEDEFDPWIGKKIALMRAFEDVDGICKFIKRIN